MEEKIKNILMIFVMAVFVFGMSVWCILKKPDDFSQSERRFLAQPPKADAENILNSNFMSGYEIYAADQFPCRDGFRMAKAFSELYLLRKLDSNDLFISGEHISKIDYPLNVKSLNNAAEKLQIIYESYLKNNDAKIYLSIIPDKNYFISEEISVPMTDYKTLVDKICNKAPYMTYINIYDLLSADDYYNTDTHWRQECIVDVSERLADKMGAKLNDKFEIKNLDKPFYGVYYGQLGLYHTPDNIKYLESDVIRQCIVTSYSTGKPEKSVIYNMEKAEGKDPYEMFLSGSEPLIIIENAVSKTDKELVIFRDSFSSSIAPLMISGYNKITLVDIRYMQTNMIGKFVEFTDQDVLFLYSTTILNNSFSFR